MKLEEGDVVILGDEFEWDLYIVTAVGRDLIGLSKDEDKFSFSITWTSVNNPSIYLISKGDFK